MSKRPKTKKQDDRIQQIVILSYHDYEALMLHLNKVVTRREGLIALLGAIETNWNLAHSADMPGQESDHSATEFYVGFGYTLEEDRK